MLLVRCASRRKFNQDVTTSSNHSITERTLFQAHEPLGHKQELQRNLIYLWKITYELSLTVKLQETLFTQCLKDQRPKTTFLHANPSGNQAILRRKQSRPILAWSIAVRLNIKGWQKYCREVFNIGLGTLGLREKSKYSVKKKLIIIVIILRHLSANKEKTNGVMATSQKHHNGMTTLTSNSSLPKQTSNQSYP